MQLVFFELTSYKTSPTKGIQSMALLEMEEEKDRGKAQPSNSNYLAIDGLLYLYNFSFHT